MERLQGDFLPAITSRWSEARDGQEPEVHQEPMPIPASFWPSLQDAAVFWSIGDARFYWPDSIEGGRSLWCFGIKFLAEQIHEMFPAPEENAPAEETSVAPPSNKGGAPRKEFWDDLLVAMFAKAWEDTWEPKSQAEVERAMLDWASVHGKDLGATSVKKPAGKLYRLLRKWGSET